MVQSFHIIDRQTKIPITRRSRHLAHGGRDDIPVWRIDDGLGAMGEQVSQKMSHTTLTSKGMIWLRRPRSMTSVSAFPSRGAVFVLAVGAPDAIKAKGHVITCLSTHNRPFLRQGRTDRREQQTCQRPSVTMLAPFPRPSLDVPRVRPTIDISEQERHQAYHQIEDTTK